MIMTIIWAIIWIGPGMNPVVIVPFLRGVKTALMDTMMIQWRMKLMFRALEIPLQMYLWMVGDLLILSATILQISSMKTNSLSGLTVTLKLDTSPMDIVWGAIFEGHLSVGSASILWSSELQRPMHHHQNRSHGMMMRIGLYPSSIPLVSVKLSNASRTSTILTSCRR